MRCRYVGQKGPAEREEHSNYTLLVVAVRDVLPRDGDLTGIATSHPSNYPTLTPVDADIDRMTIYSCGFLITQPMNTILYSDWSDKGHVVQLRLYY